MLRKGEWKLLFLPPKLSKVVHLAPYKWTLPCVEYLLLKHSICLENPFKATASLDNKLEMRSVWQLSSIKGKLNRAYWKQILWENGESQS